MSRYGVELSRMLPVADVSALTGLGWHTVKGIVQQRLQHGYGQPRLKDPEYRAIDEIYVGERKKFYTLVLDMETGQIVWDGHGRGQVAPGKFRRRVAVRSCP